MKQETTLHHSAQKRHIFTGVLLASAGAVAFSGKAIIVKLAYRYGVDAVTLIMYRMLFALPLFLALSWWASRGRPSLSRRDWAGIVGLGFCGYYLSSFLDFWGLEFVSASLERLILYLNPTLVLLLGWLLYRRRVTALQMMAMVAGYLGLMLVFGYEVKAQGPHTMLGAGLVFGSALSYAVYLLFSGEMVKKMGSLRLVGMATSVACGLCLLQFFLLRSPFAMVVAPEVIMLSVLNATLCTFAPVLMVMMAIERVGAGLASQVGMVGPLSTIVLGVWLLDEPFHPWIVVGTALVMVGVFLAGKDHATR